MPLNAALAVKYYSNKKTKSYLVFPDVAFEKYSKGQPRKLTQDDVICPSPITDPISK